MRGVAEVGLRRAVVGCFSAFGFFGLRDVVVGCSVLGGGRARAGAGAALAAAVFRVRVRFLPVLRFEPGPGLGLGRRVERILRGVGDEGAVGGRGWEVAT